MNHREESGIEQRAVVTTLGYVKLGYMLDSVGTNGGLDVRFNQRVNCFSDCKICPYINIPLPVIRKELLGDSLSSHSRQTFHTNNSYLKNWREVWRTSEGLVLVLSCTPYNFEGIETSEKEFSCNIFHSHGSVFEQRRHMKVAKKVKNYSGWIES